MNQFNLSRLRLVLVPAIHYMCMLCTSKYEIREILFRCDGMLDCRPARKLADTKHIRPRLYVSHVTLWNEPYTHPTIGLLSFVLSPIFLLFLLVFDCNCVRAFPSSFFLLSHAAANDHRPTRFGLSTLCRHADNFSGRHNHPLLNLYLAHIFHRSERDECVWKIESTYFCCHFNLGLVSELRASQCVLIGLAVQRSRKSREPPFLPFFIFKYWWQFHMKWIFTGKRYKMDDSKNETAFVIWIFIIKKETVGATEWRGWWGRRR